jgi:sulfhydrogenase subunit beta (sulfur reductase)
MKQGIIGRKNFARLAGELMKAGPLYAPVMRAGELTLAGVRPGDKLILAFSNVKRPFKSSDGGPFPKSHVLAEKDGEDLVGVPMPDEKAVVFGVRPCDALSLLCLDKVFLDEKFVDPYYGSRRENTLVISLACKDPAETCFCTSVGGSPAGKDGADILANDVGEELLFEAVTEKGEAFMQEHASLFAKAGAAETKAAKQQTAAAENKMAAVNMSGIAEKLRKLYDSPMWETSARKCLGCGVCTFLCPTCHCFAIYDEKERRVRCHDACMYTAFTLEASGHNPRGTKGQRRRQRVMHKFRYTVENFDTIFCVGCGRCIINCPVNMDIRETIATVQKGG